MQIYIEQKVAQILQVPPVRSVIAIQMQMRPRRAMLIEIKIA